MNQETKVIHLTFDYAFPTRINSPSATFTIQTLSHVVSVKARSTMGLENIFWNNKEKRIKASWRIIFQLMMMVPLVAVPVVAVIRLAEYMLKKEVIHASPEIFDKVMDIVVGILVPFMVLMSVKLAGKYLDKRTLRNFGFSLGRAWWRQYMYGILLGGFLMTFVFLVEFIFGKVEISGLLVVRAAGIHLLFASLYLIFKACSVSFYEELISRGYHLINLKEGLTGSSWLTDKQAIFGAMLITSSLFGLFHIFNDNATVLSTIGLIVIGFLFATAFVVTNQLGLPIGLHLSWNLFQGFVYGYPVSGDHEIASLIANSQLGDDDWFTGGLFGPEGGVIGILASLLGIVILVLCRNYFRCASGVHARI